MPMSMKTPPQKKFLEKVEFPIDILRKVRYTHNNNESYKQATLIRGVKFLFFEKKFGS